MVINRFNTQKTQPYIFYPWFNKHNNQAMFNHVFREGNQATDWLSKRGSTGITHEYNSNNIPEELKAILRVDNYGLPCLKMK
jgi:hypothetical protein